MKMVYAFGTTFIVSATLICTCINGAQSIINGRNSMPGEVNYDVAVVGTGLCSGGILDDTHIITAAHCVATGENNILNSVKVIAALNDTNNVDLNVSIVKYAIRAYMLAEFATERSTYDIAVLQLSGSLELDKNSDKLQKLDLPVVIDSINPNYENINYKAAGFGSSGVTITTDANGATTSSTWGGGRLQIANATVLSNNDCIKVYGGDMKNRMCLAIIQDPERKQFQGYCSGDSGAPIVVNGTTVIGVLEAGGNCNNNVYPEIASKVTAFMSFIQNAMNNTITSDMKVYNIQ